MIGSQSFKNKLEPAASTLVYVPASADTAIYMRNLLLQSYQLTIHPKEVVLKLLKTSQNRILPLRAIFKVL
jgi:hypothetical protein